MKMIIRIKSMLFPSVPAKERLLVAQTKQAGNTSTFKRMEAVCLHVKQLTPIILSKYRS